MIRLTYRTADDVLDKIENGDEISDEYYISGIVKNIEVEIVKNGKVYLFTLNTGKRIVVLR